MHERKKVYAADARLTREGFRKVNGNDQREMAALLADDTLTPKARERDVAKVRERMQQNGQTFSAVMRSREAMAREQWLDATPRARRLEAFMEDPDYARSVRDMAVTLPVTELVRIARQVSEAGLKSSALFGLEQALRSRDDLDLQQYARVQAELDRPFVQEHDSALATYVVTRNERVALEIEALPRGILDEGALGLANESYSVPAEDGRAPDLLTDSDLQRFYALADVPRGAV